jgi:hypothetical protein
MDVIKKQWNNVVMYQFWILSVFVLIAAATVFYLTSSGLNAQVAARTAKLNTTFDQISTISSSLPTHANAHSHAVLDKSALELEKDIKKAWERQYNYQIPLMIWPRDAFFDASTHSIFSTLRPVEKYIDFPLPPRLPAPYDKITLNDRQVYKQYIGPEFASVSRKMGTEWKAQLTQTASADANAIAKLPPDVVRWSKESQQTLLSQIVPWYNKGQAPSILDIYYTQEDMWLLSGIMEILKKANGDARENFQTVVREVEFIRMGQFASRNAGTLTPFASTTGGLGGYGSMSGGGEEGGMGNMGMGSGGMGSGGMGSGGGEMGSGGMGEGSAPGGDPASAVDPADNRYISFATETDFQPRKGAELRESIRTVSAANAVDAVAKRVAIRMRLKIDPSGLSRLITACGNADLLLEVYQVRVNTEPAGATGSVGGGFGGFGGGTGGSKGGMSGGGMGLGGMGMGGMGMGSSMDDGYGGEGSGSSYGGGGFGSGTAVLEDTSAEISVEIFGLIYLYNPDNIVSLGTDLAPEKLETPPSDPSAPATDAAGTTPPIANDPTNPSPLDSPALPSGESPEGVVNPTDPTNVGDGVPPPIGSN